MQIADLYAAVMHGTQELPDLAEQPDWWERMSEVQAEQGSACS
jgi:hypothetical protein